VGHPPLPQVLLRRTQRHQQTGGAALPSARTSPSARAATSRRTGQPPALRKQSRASLACDANMAIVHLRERRDGGWRRRTFPWLLPSPPSPPAPKKAAARKATNLPVDRWVNNAPVLTPALGFWSGRPLVASAAVGLLLLTQRLTRNGWVIWTGVAGISVLRLVRRLIPQNLAYTCARILSPKRGEWVSRFLRLFAP